MFTLFRYGLLPVVFFCLVVVGSSIEIFSTNAVHQSTWPQTVATVMELQDLGDVAAQIRGTPNTFPDPQGTLKYAVDGKSYAWHGRGRDIGVTVMTPGDKIKVYFDPANPQEISTLVLLGAATGSIICAVALAFLVFYVWFFWLRGFLKRSGPGDFGGDVATSFAAERVPTDKGLRRDAFDPGRKPTFGKR